ncbi:MAG: hypothetical protein U5K55_02635 [Aliarcobacter sp.]|nr:hypothetical protein [Aliarcobacter sp.]
MKLVGPSYKEVALKGSVEATLVRKDGGSFRINMMLFQCLLKM